MKDESKKQTKVLRLYFCSVYKESASCHPHQFTVAEAETGVPAPVGFSSNY